MEVLILICGGGEAAVAKCGVGMGSWEDSVAGVDELIVTLETDVARVKAGGDAEGDWDVVGDGAVSAVVLTRGTYAWYFGTDVRSPTIQQKLCLPLGTALGTAGGTTRVV